MSVKSIKKRKRLPRIDPGKEIMTRERITPFFEDIKELIVSTAKGTEKVLRKEFRQEIGGVKEELHQTQQAIKATREDLQGQIQSMGEELRVELRKDMSSMEGRLADKIDSIHTRVDDHEVRITTLEGTPQ